MQFELFRLRLFKTAQHRLFPPSGEPRDALAEALSPGADQRRRGTWHLGNIERLEGDAVYLRLGRSATAKMHRLDEEGNFLDSRVDGAQYTHCMLDLNTEVLAIATKPSLGKTPRLARRFVQCLIQRGSASVGEFDITCGPIPNPGEFLEALGRAHAITAFTYRFGRPNPFDTNKDFVKPMERLLAETGGTGGSTSVKGPELRADTLSEITRSVAAAGDDATARLRMPGARTLSTRHLRGSAATLDVDSVANGADKRNLLERIRQVYAGIRGGRDD